MKLGPLFYSTYKNYHKMDRRLKHKTWYYKTPGRKLREDVPWDCPWQWFLGEDIKRIKIKISISGTTSNLKASALQKKQQNGKATYRKEENI